LTEEALRSLFAEFYRDSFFVRLVKGSPDINWVRRQLLRPWVAGQGPSGGCLLGARQFGKGAAGQAVQNMN